ncbi:hypothetical protein O7634_25565 [Micromonospora sp. WMMD1120]|uniref:hypothetical protein n=1 Tax=Micromonospora sp. WMMD1120 TaxID=3016106 RepID=UPI0024173BD6|nr:hypothetical protein [Micromonospora sp. WMMD1120]MDG4810135.1 hypothetical protein [Micromonospora sp. WMMD1120]
MRQPCPECGRRGMPLEYRDGQQSTSWCPEGHRWPRADRPARVPEASPATAPGRGEEESTSTNVTKDGRTWRVGAQGDVAWITGRTTPSFSVTAAIPPVFEAYATVHPPEGVSPHTHERAVVQALVACTADQPWWLGYLDTGAHDVVFPRAPRVFLYADWPYVLVLAGPQQALTWRTGHMRGEGALPDLFFPVDRTWLVSALWDDTWTDIGASAAVVARLRRNPLVNARPVAPDEDACPPGLTRD